MWQKEDFLEVMAIDERKTSIFISILVYVHSALSASKGIFMDSSS